MNATYRVMLIEVAPPWLRGPVGIRFLMVLGYAMDAMDELLRQGLKARFPGVTTYESLPRIGNDRQIDRGPTEPDATYAAALSSAFDAWGAAGAARAVLDQVQRFFAPSPGYLLKLVNSTSTQDASPPISTTWYILDSLGERARVVAAPPNWNWDGLYRWWHGFAIIDSSAGPWVRCPTWGSGRKWGEGTATWGSTATRSEVASIRRRVGKWKPANVYVPCILIPMEPDLFSPAAAPGAAGMPDGLWSHHSKIVGGHRVRARNPGSLYWQGLE